MMKFTNCAEGERLHRRWKDPMWADMIDEPYTDIQYWEEDKHKTTEARIKYYAHVQTCPDCGWWEVEEAKGER